MSLIRCKCCVMPNTRPDVPFINGICSACLNYAKRPEIDWEARKAELIALLDRHDGRCIVPSSGGKDSTAQVLKLQALGADVTVVTAETCYLTEIGRANIENLSRYARTIEVQPNKTVRSFLNRKGLEIVGDVSWPQHASIWAIPFRMAIALNIPLLIWGENSQDQYGGPQGSEEARQMTQRWCSEFGGLNGLRASDFVGMDGLTAADMQDYQLPTPQEIEKAGVEGHFLGSYLPWDSHENAAISVAHGLKTELPCPANYWDFENLDCFFTAWHDHQMYRKYGYGRGCAQISIDIRFGRIGRDEGMEWVKKHDGLFPHTYLGVTTQQGLDRIGITFDELIASMDRFTNWYLFDRVEDWRPILKEFA